MRSQDLRFGSVLTIDRCGFKKECPSDDTILVFSALRDCNVRLHFGTDRIHRFSDHHSNTLFQHNRHGCLLRSFTTDPISCSMERCGGCFRRVELNTTLSSLCQAVLLKSFKIQFLHSLHICYFFVRTLLGRTTFDRSKMTDTKTTNSRGCVDGLLF